MIFKKFTQGLLLVVLIFSYLSTKANQLKTLSKKQSNVALQFLQDNKISEVILWCSCCANGKMVKLDVTKYFSRYTGIDSSYEIVIQGKSEAGVFYNDPVDLAYVFLKSGNEAKCLGQLLKFECNPCTLPFEWENYKNVPSNHKDFPQAIYLPKDTLSLVIERNAAIEKKLIGTWKDDNSTFILSANKTLVMHWTNGQTATGTWGVWDGKLNLNFTRNVSSKYMSNDYYHILVFTGKTMKTKKADATKVQTVYNSIKISD